MAMTQTQKDYIAAYEAEYSEAARRLEDARHDLSHAQTRVLAMESEVYAASKRLTSFRGAISRNQ